MNVNNCKKFQSRNREAYLFKAYTATVNGHVVGSFNLVIEKLIFSRQNNGGTPQSITRVKFQSRNREAYLFKTFVPNTGVLERDGFQSRNREAYLFKGIGGVVLGGDLQVSIS